MSDTDQSVISVGAKAEHEFNCTGCGKRMRAGEFSTFKGENGEDVYLCASCKTVAEIRQREQGDNIQYFGALALGFLGAVVGAALWAGVEIISGWQVGYIAIGVGWVVARAVFFGSGKKMSNGLSVMSAALTAGSILLAYFFIIYNQIGNYAFDDEAVNTLMHHAVSWERIRLTGIVYVSGFTSLFSPIGVLIAGIGVYYAYKQNRPNGIAPNVVSVAPPKPAVAPASSEGNSTEIPAQAKGLNPKAVEEIRQAKGLAIMGVLGALAVLLASGLIGRNSAIGMTLVLAGGAVSQIIRYRSLVSRYPAEASAVVSHNWKPLGVKPVYLWILGGGVVVIVGLLTYALSRPME